MLLLPEYSLSTLNVIHHMDALSLARGLGTGSVDAVIADSPYASTQNAWDKEPDWQALFKEFRRIVKPRGAIALFCNGRLFAKLVTMNEDIFRYEIVLEKNIPTGFLNVNRRPLVCHEYVAVFGLNAPNYYPQMTAGEKHKRGGIEGKGNDQSENYGEFTRVGKSYHEEYYPRSVWQVQKPSESRVTRKHKPNKNDLHPTQKDVGLMERLIKTYTQESEIVLDCFMGSGTTAVAARNTGRNFIGCDTHLPYVQMARKRLIETDAFEHRQVTPELKQLSMFAAIK